MLRRFDCRNCGTVYAAVDPPSACDDCGGRRFVELDGDDGAAGFFAGALR
ncbi:hypothetical protein [Halobaculum sp. MBLA0143]